ncbi:META domain-containing protein [Cognatiyoonia koreensis]|uniref:META domain-containing protein n=1 Tax=Cognatiyoonia koreensis TaxID=364200 RepID=A0A1I0RXR8_9RHOB|nr:META domain-containing protein [Cognatiyoonia koreensis]SEW46386.1 META domain-containing protein [Cognatiyoonia koreensis]
MKRYVLLFALAACGPDETISAFGSGDDYVLRELNGAPVNTQITLNISDTGQISGQAPCNSYTANQLVPYPWFEIGPVMATRRACPELALESRYFETLAAMTLAEISGPVLILSNDADDSLVFQSP